jgi:bifunctional DNA primase/polymerase-like protein
MTTATLSATRSSDGNPYLTAALTAAARGWHVFPLRPGTKRPALHGFDHCPRTGQCAARHAGWEQRATTNPVRIRAAWSAGPFNIGLATGPSGLVVIDLDSARPGETPPEPWNQPGIRDGQDVLAALADQSSQPYPADTLTVATPSGGLHLYYMAPGDAALRNTAGTGLGWKIDTRAHGGYVVAPGSIVDGRAYEITADQEPAPLPDWLLDRLRPAPLPPAPEHPVPVPSSRRSRYLDAALRAEAAKVQQAPDRQRNATLYAAALALGQLVAGGALPEDEVRAALLTAAGRHIAVGAYSERQAHQTIGSGLRAGANRPRQVA